ncbi:RluA family pseudouridine synthase [Candidatus Dojkabacteria bacterium]|nr:RluA family pseudouridine synthase [Candidatus Dojkabacteria bacterium]
MIEKNENLINEILCDAGGYVVTDKYVDVRIDKFLALAFRDLSRSQIVRLFELKAVLVNKKIVKKPSFRLRISDIVNVDSNIFNEFKKKLAGESSLLKFSDEGDESAITSQKGDLDIVYECNDFMIINKQAGVVVHPGTGHFSDTIANYLVHYFKENKIPVPRRVGLVSRLDKDVSGLMVIAKNDLMLSFLASQFSGEGISRIHKENIKKANKVYWAVVGPRTNDFMKGAHLMPGSKEVELEGYIRRNIKNRRKFEFSSKPEGFYNGDIGRYCLSYVRCIKSLDPNEYWLLEIRIITGRTHQIRSQLSAVGLPIVGDELYGGEDLGKSKYLLNENIVDESLGWGSGICLKCVKLCFWDYTFVEKFMNDELVVSDFPSKFCFELFRTS